MFFDIADVEYGKAALSREILDDLPEWFGIPGAKAAYISASEHLPMIAGLIQGQPVGLVSLKFHTEFACELYLLAVKRKFHRQGIGTALVNSGIARAKLRGVSFLTVKTLAPSNPNPQYQITRQFYDAVGFVPVEVFPTLWDARNPCLMMVKTLS